MELSNILFIHDCIHSFSQIQNCDYLPIIICDTQFNLFTLKSNYTEQKVYS